MRAIVAAAFALMLVSPAYASDFYSDVAYDWTVVYGGVHAGFIQANVTVDGRARLIEGQPSTDRLDLSYERDFDGFVGGALGGVNFQAGSFVFGLDMDFGGVVADGEGTENIEGTEEDVRFQHGIDWTAHVRGRLGFALDRVLVYGAGDWPLRISTSKAIEACKAIMTSTMAAMQPAGVRVGASSMQRPIICSSAPNSSMTSTPMKNLL
jgi:outer membrane immunogenic protein